MKFESNSLLLRQHPWPPASSSTHHEYRFPSVVAALRDGDNLLVVQIDPRGIYRHVLAGLAQTTHVSGEIRLSQRRISLLMTSTT